MEESIKSSRSNKYIFGNRLKLARKYRNLTQSDLACLVGCSRNTICSIERCEYYPGINLALLICKALKIKVEDIFYCFEKL